MPLSFFGQEEGTDNAKHEKKSTSFSSFLFLQGQFGPSWFHGDLARYGVAPDLENTSVSGGLGIGYQVLPWLNFTANAQRGFVKGQQQGIVPKNNIGAGAGVAQDLKMNMDYVSGDIQASINLVNLFAGYKDRLFSISLHGGLGQSQFNSRTEDQITGARVANRGKYAADGSPAQGKGISNRKVAMTIPVGAELTFAVAEKWDVYGDYTYTWMATDWADNVIHGEQEVVNDAYAHFNIGLRYKFVGKNPAKMANTFDEVDIVATPNPLQEVGDSVEVTIKGTFPPKYFNEDAIMCFTPTLKWDDGMYAFDRVYFIGEDVEGEGTMISNKNGGSFTYNAKIAYNDDMAVS